MTNELAQEIQIVDIDQLDEIECGTVLRLAKQYLPKIRRALKNDVHLIVHVKKYDEEGRQQKYSVHIRVLGPTRPLAAASDDWYLNTALHDSFKNLFSQIEHDF